MIVKIVIMLYNLQDNSVEHLHNLKTYNLDIYFILNLAKSISDILIIYSSSLVYKDIE